MKVTIKVEEIAPGATLTGGFAPATIQWNRRDEPRIGDAIGPRSDQPKTLVVDSDDPVALCVLVQEFVERSLGKLPLRVELEMASQRVEAMKKEFDVQRSKFESELMFTTSLREQLAAAKKELVEGAELVAAAREKFAKRGIRWSRGLAWRAAKFVNAHEPLTVEGEFDSDRGA